MTRQKAFEERQRALGLCTSCRARAYSSGMCLKHFLAKVDRQRRPEIKRQRFLETIAFVDGHRIEGRA